MKSNNFIYNTGKQLAFSYNSLNLPQITDNGVNGKMQSLYNAAGQKLRTTLFDSPANITDTTDYVSNFIYKNGQLSYILMPEGRILVTEPAEVPNGSTFSYEYHLKDHLGNTRATYIAGANGTSTLTQTTAYYPFGLPIASASSATGLENNPYLYNGKELHSELNMDLLDYGARFYDAEIGRWWSVDPMAEMRLNLSPYNYVQNNPIYLIDPNGMYDEAADIGGFWKRDPDEVTGQTTINSNGETEVYIGTINVFANAKNGMLSHEQIEDFYNLGLFNGSGGPGDPHKKTKSWYDNAGVYLTGVALTIEDVYNSFFYDHLGYTTTRGAYKLFSDFDGRNPSIRASEAMKNSKFVKNLGFAGTVLMTAQAGTEILTYDSPAPVAYADVVVGLAGIAAGVGEYSTLYTIPYVGEFVAFYSMGRLLFDLGGAYGPSTWGKSNNESIVQEYMRRQGKLNN